MSIWPQVLDTHDFIYFSTVVAKGGKLDQFYPKVKQESLVGPKPWNQDVCPESFTPETLALENVYQLLCEETLSLKISRPQKAFLSERGEKKRGIEGRKGSKAKCLLEKYGKRKTKKGEKRSELQERNRGKK